MKIALIGYGKMGRMIEGVAVEKGHQISSRIDPVAKDATHASVSAESLHGADIAIEFTTPQTAISNIEAVLDAGTPLVVGTTGWLGRIAEVRALVDAKQGRLVYGANYSIGVNLFYRIVAEAARLMDGFPQYDVGGFESHHNQKADSPSGTAKALAAILLKNVKRKQTLVSDGLAERKPDPSELHFASLRVGAVPGAHSVIFDSASDTIELRHVARSREGLARGAVMAAEWLISSGRSGLIPVDEMWGEL
jgi:4-hydroxy-tetrahydrodipicolinate reductase